MAPQRLLTVLACVGWTIAAVGCEARVPPIPETFVDPPLPEHTPRPLPKASHDGLGADGGLLEDLVGRQPRKDEDLARWALPYNGKTAIVELMIAAAVDDAARMAVLLADDAKWGLPDRRELQAQPVFHPDDPLGIEALTALRNTASRFAKRARFTVTPMQPGFEAFTVSGAEPFWATYSSADGLDLMTFRVRNKAGRVVIDYIGLFEERPEEPQRVVGVGDPPPEVPYAMRPPEFLVVAPAAGAPAGG